MDYLSIIYRFQMATNLLERQGHHKECVSTTIKYLTNILN